MFLLILIYSILCSKIIDETYGSKCRKNVKKFHSCFLFHLFNQIISWATSNFSLLIRQTHATGRSVLHSKHRVKAGGQARQLPPQFYVCIGRGGRNSKASQIWSTHHRISLSEQAYTWCIYISKNKSVILKRKQHVYLVLISKLLVKHTLGSWHYKHQKTTYQCMKMTLHMLDWIKILWYVGYLAWLATLDWAHVHPCQHFKWVNLYLPRIHTKWSMLRPFWQN